MNLRRLLTPGLLVALLAPESARALEWARTQIATVPERGADVVRVKFDYKNTGAAVVHFLEVRTSCGCTEATTTASEVAPGESGAVDVLFTIGRRAGLQEKEITLLTDDSNAPVRLTLKVKLPEAK
jgi:hypothetical protein